MSRLTQTSNLGGVALTFDLDVTCTQSEMKKILKLVEKLKKYEDAEEQGLLYTKVFTIEYECKYDKPVVCILNCKKCDLGILCMKEIFIKTTEFDKTKHYKTKEEADQALKQMGE